MTSIAAVRRATTARRRDHDLASVGRAGRWTRGELRRRHYRYLRRAWPFAAGFAATMAAVAALVCMAAPSAHRDAIAAAFGATTVWLVVLGVIVGSGTAPLIMGDTGEQWTAATLRALRGRGWRSMHHVTLRFGNIDHIAFGPAGVVVVETKWRARAWDASPDAIAVLRAAVNQARTNARDVALTLRSQLPTAPLHAVVVLWTAADSTNLAPRVNEDVTVVAGRDLEGWIARLDDAGLARADIDRAWEWLASQAARRDEFDLARYGPPPRSVTDLVVVAARYVAGAAGSFFIAAAAVTRLPSWAWPIVAVALSVPAIVARRWRAVRNVAAGWLFGVAAAAVIVAAVFAAVAVT
jgi:Holliday junction resolvase-like predicted endonuclease